MAQKEKDPHVGLARKYRPQLFDDIAGQEAVSTTLKNAIAGGKPGQAYLFFGPRGVGKTTTARILAKALNCKKGPTETPCGKCDSCEEIARSSSIDVLELDAATNTQVDRIREMIIETVSLVPSRDRFKIFIIDEVHMLSNASFNALLKTLEEPPPHVVFILATTEQAKIPATIVSRCQRFRFRPVPQEVLVGHLEKLAKSEKIAVGKDALEILARSAGGSLRDAVSLLEQSSSHASTEGKVTFESVSDLLGHLPEDLTLQLLTAVVEKTPLALSQALESVFDQGFDAAQLLRDLRDKFHACFLSRLGVGGELPASLKALADKQSPETFSFLVQRTNKTLEQLRTADSIRLTLELGLFGMLEAAYDLREWVRRLEALEGKVSTGGAAPSPQPMPAPQRAHQPQPQPAAARPQPVPPQPSPQQAAPQQTVSRPAASSGPSAWSQMITQLQEAKPGLANILKNGSVAFSDGPEWRVLLQRAFDIDLAQKSQQLIETQLSQFAGKLVRVKFDVSAGGAATEDAPLPRPAPVEDPALKRVLEVFPGKVKQIKKK